MKKILLAILIIVTGLKLIADSGRFSYKHSIIDLATQDEESKNKNEDNKPGKTCNEDFFYINAEINSSTQVIVVIAPSSTRPKAYISFSFTPDTPPPNFS